MKREHWGSKIGFIMATSGAAVGLGNVLRFPYITAQFGGALFVLIYLFCVIAIGLPLMLVEFAIGRHTQHNPVNALKMLRPKSAWKYVGFFGILTAFFILTYYSVAASWTLGYVFYLFKGSAPPLETFAANPYQVLGSMSFFLILTAFVVKTGLKNGIERCSKILMPLLFLLLIGLVVRSVTLPNSFEGLKYYLYPNFSELSGKVFLYALGQAFFSLCVGEAVLLTYGSYASKKDNLISSAYSIALFDTLIAVLSGLILFPALFAFGQEPDQGVGLIFNVMPQIFLKMPFGSLIGMAFFLLLAFAAFTTAIALMEIPVSYLMEAKKWSRKKATTLVALAAFIIGIPSALSKGASSSLTSFKIPFIDHVGFYEIMDFSWGGLAMVIGGFLLCIFVGWVWGTENALKELRKGSPHFSWQGDIWAFIIKYLAPLAIISIFLSFLF